MIFHNSSSKKTLSNKLRFFLISVLILNTSAFAQEVPTENTSSKYQVRGVAGMALTFGGDEISREVVDSAFSGTDTETIDAGELIYFYGGFYIDQEKYQIQTTIGYHIDQISGDNGDTGFCRYPLEVIGFAKLQNFRVGAGISYHLSPEYERDVDGDPKLSADFDNASGLVVQADYIFGFGSRPGGAALGFRYTDIEYKISSSNFGAEAGRKIDGSNFGLNLSYLF